MEPMGIEPFLHCCSPFPRPAEATKEDENEADEEQVASLYTIDGP